MTNEQQADKKTPMQAATWTRNVDATKEGRRRLAERCFNLSCDAESNATDCELSGLKMGYVAYKLAAFAWGIYGARAERESIPERLSQMQATVELLVDLYPEFFGTWPGTEDKADFLESAMQAFRGAVHEEAAKPKDS